MCIHAVGMIQTSLIRTPMGWSIFQKVEMHEKLLLADIGILFGEVSLF